MTACKNGDLKEKEEDREREVEVGELFKEDYIDEGQQRQTPDFCLSL